MGTKGIVDVDPQGFLSAASAYFKNLAPKKKYQISQLFTMADTNGDGLISFKEFQQASKSFAGATSPSSSSGDSFNSFLGKFFKEFAKTNGGGKLTFNEFISFYYLVETGRKELMCEGGHGVCDGHGCESYFVKGGLYFVCVVCFDDPNKEESFNLCTSCYLDGKYNHQHDNFVDNFVLLCSNKFVRKSTALTTVTQNHQVDPTMEEIHLTALAYYNNLSLANKQLANQIFKDMDSNGDGAISLHEYETKFGRSLGRKKCFAEVDRNKDGTLNFEEFITFYYLDQGGRLNVWCKGYGCAQAPFLKGAYFVCVNCFNSQSEEFYLCISCYGNVKYTHGHTNFMDNCMLLQQKKGPNIPQSPDQGQPAAPQNSQGTGTGTGAGTGPMVVAGQAISLGSNLVNMGINIVNFVSSVGACNIL